MLLTIPVSDAYDEQPLLSAMFAGGDSRTEVDPRTGLNKYLCPLVPAPRIICASSCTASPISPASLADAAAAWSEITHAPSPRKRSERIVALTDQIETRLLRYFGIGALARAFLCPSGTDALLTTALLVAAEQPEKAITAILPSASETGTGVPMAALGRMFDGPKSGKSLTGHLGTVVEVPLRAADGRPRGDDALNDAFAAAADAATGHVIVYLTHGSKTGLIAPVSPPPDVDVIVDACQARIAPETVAAYIRRGWPVVVTGSKFFGGPAFSGALFYPLSRRPPLPASTSGDRVRVGAALRWTAALTIMDAFEPMAAGMAAILARRTAAIKQAFASNAALVPIEGPRSRGPGWADQPSIFTFGIRDPKNRLLSVTELRPIYERLARGGVLLGQPVGSGSHGGLRLAIGARELLDSNGDDRLHRVFEALSEAAGR